MREFIRCCWWYTINEFLSFIITFTFMICMLFQDSYVFVPKTKNISQKGLIIIFKDSNIFLRELKFKWPTIKFLGLFNRKVFSSIKQSVRLLEELGLQLTELELSWSLSIYWLNILFIFYLNSNKDAEQHLTFQNLS